MQSLHKQSDNMELAIENRNINRSHSLLAESNFITFINLLKMALLAHYFLHANHTVTFLSFTYCKESYPMLDNL